MRSVLFAVTWMSKRSGTLPVAAGPAGRTGPPPPSSKMFGSTSKRRVQTRVVDDHAAEHGPLASPRSHRSASTIDEPLR